VLVWTKRSPPIFFVLGRADFYFFSRPAGRILNCTHKTTAGAPSDCFFSPLFADIKSFCFFPMEGAQEPPFPSSPRRLHQILPQVNTPLGLFPRARAIRPRILYCQEPLSFTFLRSSCFPNPCYWSSPDVSPPPSNEIAHVTRPLLFPSTFFYRGA